MKIFNKRARFEYQLTGDRLEVGLSLKGMEAKSLREGRGDISQSYVKIVNNEAFLINANIPVAGAQKYDATRTRKLLLHKAEILSILTKTKQQNLQIVPIVLYNKRGRIKLEVALGKGKRKFEKKDSIKKKDIDRDIEREFRGRE